MICKPSWMRKPKKDFYENAKLDVSGYFAESETHFYSLDGMKRLKKSGGNGKVDNARRKVFRTEDKEEREYWMKKLRLM